MLVAGLLLFSYYFLVLLLVWNSCKSVLVRSVLLLVCHSFIYVSFKNVSFKNVLFRSCVIVAFICVIGDSGNEIECVACWLECLWWPSMVGVLTGGELTVVGGESGGMKGAGTAQRSVYENIDCDVFCVS